MALKRVSAPTDTPVSLAEAKAHLRVDHDDEDILISALIDAATEHVDGPRGVLGRAMIDQTWDYYLDEFPDAEIELPLPPLIEVLGVYYQTSTGEEEFTAYEVDDASEPARLSLNSGSWPTASTVKNAVRIRFRAGYLDTGVSPAVAAVPNPIKAAMLLYIGDLYAHRETQVDNRIGQLPWSAEQLLRPHKFSLSFA